MHWSSLKPAWTLANTLLAVARVDAETVLRLINNAKQQTEKINQLLNQLPNTIDHSE